MELKDFIKNSLVSIAEGVEGASTERGEAGKKFSIRSFDHMKFGEQYIDFDIAVVTSSEGSVKGKVEGKIFVAGAGVEGHVKEGTENISRIKFKVFHGNV